MVIVGQQPVGFARAPGTAEVRVHRARVVERRLDDAPGALDPDLMIAPHAERSEACQQRLFRAGRIHERPVGVAAAGERVRLLVDEAAEVGLDIVGDKLMEINVFSPGGLGSSQKLEGVNFNDAVVDSLERKVGYMGYYKRNFNNVEMATL